MAKKMAKNYLYSNIILSAGDYFMKGDYVVPTYAAPLGSTKNEVYKVIGIWSPGLPAPDTSTFHSSGNEYCLYVQKPDDDIDDAKGKIWRLHMAFVNHVTPRGEILKHTKEWDWMDHHGSWNGGW